MNVKWSVTHQQTGHSATRAAFLVEHFIIVDTLFACFVYNENYIQVNALPHVSSTWVKRYKISNNQTTHTSTIEDLLIHRLSADACQSYAIREPIRLIYLLKSILISAKTMAPNENAYTFMARRNAKRSGVIYSLRHFAFDFEVIRCNRNACGHVWFHSAIFGGVRAPSAL